jgi:hypothetical protein
MLEWTGERFLPWIEGAQINYEHLHRYAFAAQFVKGKKVLDLANEIHVLYETDSLMRP